ncbi:MAG TPA: hypothetical protein VGD80_37225 [Kofleriaceae bacterium]
MPRCRDLESLHAARKRQLVLRLDEQVHVRALKTDVDDPDPLADRCSDRRVAHRLVQLTAAQAADRGHDAQHDMKPLLGPDLRPLLVR